MRYSLLQLNLQPGVEIFLVILFFILCAVAIFFLVRGIRKDRNRYIAEKYNINELDSAVFTQMLAHAYSIADEDTHFAVMLIRVNDEATLCASIGEKQMKRVMSTIKERLIRAIPHGSKLCLYDADQFIVFIPEDLDGLAMTNIATITIKEVIKPIALISRAKINITVNVGFAANNEFSTDAADLLQNVQIALANSAKEGVNLFSIYSRELAEQQTEEYKQYQEIRRAIAQKQFVLYYQPIYDLSEDRPVAYESLVRWQHPERGILTPDRFLPIMEQTGDVNWLGLWAFEEMLKDFTRYEREHGAQARAAIFSFNLSPKQLMYPHLAEEIRKIYKKYRVPAANICLEIVEFSMFDKVPEVSSNILKLTQMGFKIAVDDFGLEMSSLKLLENINFDWIKLDKKFIEQAQDDFLIGGVVETLVGFSDRKNCKIVAEGVENDVIYNYVKELKIHYGQGYYFGKPLPYDGYLK